MSKKKKIIPELRFPEFLNKKEWEYLNGDKLFEPISNKNHNSDLPILAITQEQGAIPRELINYHVSVSDKSVESYKVIEVGDFIISLRSFQGGIEYSNYLGLCSPAYIILRKKLDVVNDFYRHYFKSSPFIQDLNKNLEGIRDGKMVSYKQFSEILIPKPNKLEQKKIASCLSTLEELITAQSDKLEALKNHKIGLMQNLFPQEGKTIPMLRFPEFGNDGNWEVINNSVKIISGNAYKKSLYSNDGIRLVQGANIFNGRYSDENTIYINPLDVSEQRNIQITNGDILLALNRPITNNELKVCLYPFDKGFLYQRAGRLEHKSNLDKNFLYQFLCTPLFLERLKNQLVGSDQPYIKSTLFTKDILMAPAKLEQKKIASCLSALDESITSQSEKIEQLQRHKKGLMQGLFPKIES